MPLFHEGDHPKAGTPAVQVYRFTFGVALANGNVTPCTAQGEAAEFVFGDTQPGIDTVRNGFGVALHSLTHSGGRGVPVLAGGPIAEGDEIVVGMANFTNDAGEIVSLPVAISVDDAAEDDVIVGKATMGSMAAAKDASIHRPSIALEFYTQPKKVVPAPPGP